MDLNDASSFSKLNDQMAKALNPFSTVHDYAIGSSMSEYRRMQEQMALALKPVLPLHEYASSFSKLNDQMAKALNPFSTVHDYVVGSGISEFMKKTQFGSIKSLIDSVGSYHDTMKGSSYFDSINDTLQKLDFSSLSITEKVEKDFEAQIEFLLPENKKAFDDIMIALIKIFPEIKNIQDAYKSKKYVQLLTHGIVYIFVIMLFFNQLYSLILTPIPLYKINRDNVRIRTEPSTDDPSSIIRKLNKNIVVVKIDSQKNWVKIEFENDQGEIVGGWVRNDMLTKIEQK